MLTPAEATTIPLESPSERRFYPRVTPSVPVRVAFAGDNLGLLLNLSENGLLVSTPLALLENFVCRISLLLYGLAQPIDVYARVVWTSESRLAGIQLLDLCDDDREQLRRWAAAEQKHRTEAAPAPPAPSRVSPAAPPEISAARFSEKSTGAQGARLIPLKLSSSLLPLAAGTLATLLLLVAILIFRGTSFRGWLTHSFKPGTSANMAMQPGGAVANASPAPQTQLSVPATSAPVQPRPNPESAQVAQAAPQPAPTAAPSLADNEATQTLAQRSTNPPHTNSAAAAPSTRSKSLAKNSNVVSPAESLASSKKANVIPSQAPEIAATPVRNRSILEAQKHFGDRYIGHLDLAASANDSSQASPPIPEAVATTHNASVVAPVPSPRDPQPNSAKSNNSANHSSPPPPRPSAITGSIARNSTHEENAASPQPTTPSPRISPEPTATPAATTPATPQNRTLQLTLPNSARSSYINLPGEQVLQSPSMTLHIQRAILAPPAPGSAPPRKETVVVGDLLSHVAPWTPHLSQETGTRVGIRAFLSADGRVEKLMPVNGSVALVSSAVRAVRQWQFQPTLLAGQPVPMAIYVLVEFHPEADNSARP